MANEIHLIDKDLAFRLLLEERERVDRHSENQEAAIRVDEASECAGIISHMDDYTTADRPTITVSDIMGYYMRYANVNFVMKRCDNGREYRKIKDSLDERNNWEVVRICPRIVTKGLHGECAKIEIVLWVNDRGTAIDKKYMDIRCDMTIENYRKTIGIEASKDGA